MNFTNLFILCFACLFVLKVNSKTLNSSHFSFPLLTHHLVETCDLRTLYLNKVSIDETVTIGGLKVGIVGAGVSGLYAALLLQDLGVEYEILEATNRVGGRFYTHYFGKTCRDYNYVEMGAMRFPKVKQYERLIGDKHWSLIAYLNSKLSEENKIKLIPFETRSENNIFYFNDIRRFRFEFEKCGDLFGFRKSDGGVIDDRFTNINVLFWEEKAYRLVAEKINRSFSDAFDYLLRNDYKTFRGFLMDPTNEELSYPPVVVDWIEAFSAGTGRFSASLMDVYLGERFLSSEFVTIDGGSSVLIESINNLLNNKPKLYQKVTAVNQMDTNNILLETTNGRYEYSHVILTPTFSVLRDLDFKCNLHLKKRSAMRTLNYEFALKVGFEFKSRFWENAKLMNGKPIFGGVSVTDLLLRHIFYPSYGVNCSTCRGPLLVSYTWSLDAKKFLPYSEEEIVTKLLANLAIIHGSVVYEQFTGNYTIMDWTLNPYAQGAFSAFDPGNFMSYYPYLIHPEANGRLHFAGDTLSVYHGWSIGALTAAFRAVKDILTVQGMDYKIEELQSKWGVINEPDLRYFWG